MDRELFFHNELPEPALHGRLKPEEAGQFNFMPAYYRDSTQIMHSYPFRRLKHKTQVFFSLTNDHVCTRIEHVMHVAGVAAAICRALGLDSDLAWAIGLGHDLGHAPFGHTGEEILNECCPDIPFHHEQYGLRVVDILADKGRGLNLCHAVRDGIIHHCGERFEQYIEPNFSIQNLSESGPPHVAYPCTWEGCITRMADKIAYLGRDMEDAVSQKLIRKEDLPARVKEILGDNNRQIIGILVQDLIAESMRTRRIGFSDRIYEAFMELKTFNIEHIYQNDRLAGVRDACKRVIKKLFSYLTDIYGRYHLDIKGYGEERNSVAAGFAGYLTAMTELYSKESEAHRAPHDYLAGMTDLFAHTSIRGLFGLDGHYAS